MITKEQLTNEQRVELFNIVFGDIAHSRSFKSCEMIDMLGDDEYWFNQVTTATWKTDLRNALHKLGLKLPKHLESKPQKDYDPGLSRNS